MSGTVLAPRTFLGDGALAAAGFVACGGLYGVAQAPGTRQPWPYAGVGLALVVLVAVPLAWAGLRLRRLRVEVEPDRVRLRVGPRVVRELSLDELVSVRAADQVSMSTLRGPQALPAVLLVTGRARLLVSRHQVEDLGPLMDVLDPVLERRPDLLQDDASRTAYAHYRAAEGG